MVEKFQEEINKSKKNLQIADHMLSVTYPLIQDPKILLSIIDNIFLAYTNALSSIVHHDRLFKKIPPFEDNFKSKLNIFKEQILIHHNIDKTCTSDIQEIKNILTEHKNSPVEFARKNQFVICSEDYKIKTIDIHKIQNYLNKAKIFIQVIDNIISKNESIFR